MSGSLLKTVFRKIKSIFRRREHDPRLLLLKKMPRSAVCAEIGVWKGDFSQCIQKLTSPRALHLIDPWLLQTEFPDRMYGGSVAQNQKDMDHIYEDVRLKFNDHKNIFLLRWMGTAKGRLLVPTGQSNLQGGDQEIRLRNFNNLSI